MKNFSFKDWLWVAYPILVIVGIFIGVSLLFGDGGKRIANITGAGKELEVQKAELLRLQLKEQVLQAVDTERETATLVRLTEAMPATKKIWLLVSELNLAGNEALVAMTDLEGNADEVKDATIAATPKPLVPGITDTLELTAKYDIAEFEQVKKIVDKLDRMLPLVKINKLSYDAGALDLTVEGAWSNWNKVASESLNTLPEISNSVTETEAKLAGFESLPAIDPNAGDFVFTVNPF